MVDTVIVARGSDNERRVVVSWTAIFVGWLVALGFAWLFYVTGVAVGFSAFDLNAPDAVAKGIGIGTTIWVILTWAVSLFLGGMFASWVDARSDATVGALHGVAVWGLASGMTLLLAAMGFTNLLQGAAGLLKTTAAAGAAAATAGAPADNAVARSTSLLGAQLSRAVAQSSGRQGVPTAASGSAGVTTAAPNATAPTMPGAAVESRSAALPRESMSAVASDLLRGRNDDAKARLVAERGLQPAEVDAALQSLSAQIERSKAQVHEAAEQARRYSAAALWGVVLSTLIGLIAAAFGGSLGAGQVERFYDRRAV